jgi:hypothetical protein
VVAVVVGGVTIKGLAPRDVDYAFAPIRIAASNTMD